MSALRSTVGEAIASRPGATPTAALIGIKHRLIIKGKVFIIG